MTHRPDIDGLRALAVIPVVLFHMDLAAFGGGFTGVDVFFVISGYLITGIIVHDLTTRGRRFSLATFYERRVRRIFPALFTVLAVTTILAAMILLPRDFEAFAKSLVATAAFASNIHFDRQFGYFDTEAHAKPLLHTWSLAVEEQFYLVFPLLMVALFAWVMRRTAFTTEAQRGTARATEGDGGASLTSESARGTARSAEDGNDAWGGFRLQVRRVRLVLGLLALASFALATWQVFSGRANSAFYLAPARAWELLLGSLLALGAFPAFRARRAAECAAVAGLALLGTAFLTFSLETPFPGPAALVPTLGAALLIHSGSVVTSSPPTPPVIDESRPTIVARLLSSRPLVGIGLISYSLYLWHWALLSMARHWTLEPLTLAQTTAVVLFSVAASAASWKWIEQPARSRKGMRGRTRDAMTGARGEMRGPAPLLETRLSTQSSHLESSRTQPRAWSRPAIFAAGAALSAAAIGVGVLGAVSGGWPSRIDPTVLALDAAQLDFNKERPRCHGDDRHAIPYRDTCRFGAPTVAPRYAVWGDSHAAELAVALGEVAERVGESVRMISFSACPPALPVAEAARSPGCLVHNRAMLDGIRADRHVETVFLTARYSQAVDELGDGYFDRLGDVARELVDAGKRVAIVYPSPEYPYLVPVQLARAAHREESLDSLGLSRDLFEARRAPYRAALDRIRAKGRIEMVDPAARLCDAERCRIYAEGHVLYFDDDHLSLAGARYLAPLFAPWFDLPASALVANQ